MNIDLQTLKIFIDVVDQGSFAAVSRQRNLDPSSISRTISGLEEMLNVRLFQRTTRKLTPTEAGIRYYQRMLPLVTDMEQACLEARDLSMVPVGTLRVTTSLAFGQKVLAPMLPDFNKQYPALSLDLILTDVNLDLIAERIDVAIRLGPRPDANFIGTKLKTIKYKVCASPSFLNSCKPIKKPQDLETLNCLRMSLPGHRTLWKFRDQERNITEVPVTGTVTISNPLALYEAVLHGSGPALLADIFVEKDIRQKKLVDVFPEYEITATDFDTAAWLLYVSKSYLPTKTRTFIDFMKAHDR